MHILFISIILFMTIVVAKSLWRSTEYKPTLFTNSKKANKEETKLFEALSKFFDEQTVYVKYKSKFFDSGSDNLKYNKIYSVRKIFFDSKDNKMKYELNEEKGNYSIENFEITQAI